MFRATTEIEPNAAELEFGEEFSSDNDLFLMDTEVLILLEKEYADSIKPNE